MAWRPVPILPSRDVAITRSFWESLGFHVVDASPNDEPYLIAEREHAELHFFSLPDLDPATSSHKCYIAVADVDATYAEWSQLGLADSGPGSIGEPVTMPWQLRESALIDPNGTLVRLASPTQTPTSTSTSTSTST